MDGGDYNIQPPGRVLSPRPFYLCTRVRLVLLFVFCSKLFIFFALFLFFVLDLCFALVVALVMNFLPVFLGVRNHCDLVPDTSSLVACRDIEACITMLFRHGAGALSLENARCLDG